MQRRSAAMTPVAMRCSALAIVSVNVFDFVSSFPSRYL